jgi:predicted  nucleic acid-binding Zn-ribbon protein
MNLNDKIDQVDLKARQLGLKMQHLQDRNEKLVGETRNLRHQLNNAINMIADMEERLETAEAAASKKQSSDPKEVKDMRKQIDASIEDMDNAIEWMEKG